MDRVQQTGDRCAVEGLKKTEDKWGQTEEKTIDEASEDVGETLLHLKKHDPFTNT